MAVLAGSRPRIAGFFLTVLILSCQAHQGQAIWTDAKNAFGGLAQHFGFGGGSVGAREKGEEEVAGATKNEWSDTETFDITKEEDLFKVLEKAKEGRHDLVVMEVYASWCGACKKFRQVWEEVANYFNTGFEILGDQRDPNLPRVLIARANCGGQDSLKKFCNKFNVEQWPMILYGSPERFRNHLSVSKPEDLDSFDKVNDLVLEMPYQLKFKGVMTCITFFEQYALKQAGLREGLKLGFVSYTEEKRNEELAKFKSKRKVRGGSATVVHDMEISTGLALKYLNNALNLKKEGARDAFIHWQGWIAHFHPSEKCMQGAIDILADLDTIWPEGADPDKVEDNLMEVKQCGDEVELDETQFWSCTEYTCGLWMTFHAMSVQDDAYISPTGEDSFTGADMMSTLHGFIDKFFMCEVCRRHFLQVLAQESVGPTLQRTHEVQSQKDFALWLWEAHNVVNIRLAGEEAENGNGDPERPKYVFPNDEDCSVCKVDSRGHYSVDHVHKYLEIVYQNPVRKHPDLPGYEKRETLQEKEQKEMEIQREQRQREWEEKRKKEEEEEAGEGAARRARERRERQERRNRRKNQEHQSGLFRVLFAVVIIIVGCGALLIYYQKYMLQQKSYKAYKGYYD